MATMTSRLLQIGDVVSLRSGGPEMTVTGKLRNYEDVECSWFMKRQFCCEDFPPSTLILVRPIEDGDAR